MNRRKKKLRYKAEQAELNPPGVRYPAIVKIIEEKSTHEYICEGCERVGEDPRDEDNHICRVYGYVPSCYIRIGCCPFNRKLQTGKGNKVRVGQQKTKSQRIR